MGKQEDIRGLLAQQFEGFEAEPEFDLWPGIEAKLHPGKKRKIAWFTIITVAASIAMLFGLIRLLNAPVEIQAPVVEQKSPVVHPEDKEVQNSAPLLAENREVEKEITNALEQSRQEGTPVHKDAHQNGMAPVQQVGFPEPKNEGRTEGQSLDPQTLLVEHETKEAELPQIEKIQVQGKKPEVALTEPSQNQNIVDEQNLAIRTSNRQVRNNSLDLSDLTLQNFVAFTANELSKIDRSPIDVYQEAGEDGETKIYQFDLFNLSFTHKSHKRRVKNL